MLTNARVDRLVVISDLHLGNPFSKAQAKTVAFLKWAATNGFDVCINGDGLEIAQASFARMSRDIPAVLGALKSLRNAGRQIYYVVGNHDMALENFLEDWGLLKVSPFLNLHSGDRRIRIEHGHLYDAFFVRHPVIYEGLTHLAGILLKVWPSAYRLWIAFEKWKANSRARKIGIPGEPPEFAEAALELAARGFDDVVFGHTHHPGQVKLFDDRRYFNPGSFALSNHYVAIEHGSVELREWQPGAAQAAERRASSF